GDEIRPDDPEGIIATGFLRMGPWELTGMEVAKVARQRFLDDVTNSVGETFLGHSLQCARCHDHKFDPVPTRDYYSIQSVFATTQLTERSAAFLAGENTSGFEERKYLELQRNRHSETLKELDEVLLENAQKWYAEQGKSPEAWNAELERIRKNNDGAIFNNVRQALRNAGQQEDEYPPKLVGFTPAEFGLERVSRKGLQRLDWEFDRYEPFALAVYNGRTPQVKNIASPTRIPADRMENGELEETCILAGGDPFSPTEPTPPNALSVLNDQLQAEFPTSVEGRRTALADWIANPKNPLTSRVIVNRIWQWHFGRAIAGNPNNFGSTGQRPTHPELLDWLAIQFLEDGWSIKSLHRHILNSDAYARSTTHPQADELAESDPAATAWLVFQPRRLSAEELRDSMLTASGELNRTVGGIPARPEINLEVALQPRMVMGTFAAAWTPNTSPSQRHRRSLYVLRLRGLVPPLLEVFNSPAPDFSCERRESSTVTPQVFAQFNGNNSHARALALANRLLSETNSDAEALTESYRLLYSRSPTREEAADILKFWKNLEASLPETLEPIESQPLEVVRTAVEENTGEHFSFTETLYSNRDFVPDLRPYQVNRHVRAFADICLVLFNSNEFVYVY
ncbi:MAG: DUF1553 domain-containing protein, partial [Planctomycetaceae bacterium]|nr:DUF1553 domain-containing protein [Planctomycetaceae bacterium]